MSYAIIRNEKLTRAESYGAYVHNDRKAKNHSPSYKDLSDIANKIKDMAFTYQTLPVMQHIYTLPHGQHVLKIKCGGSLRPATLIV